MSAKYAQLTAARNASSGDAQHSPPPRGSVVSLKAAAAERAVLEHLVAEHVDIETRRSDGGRAALDVENAAKNHRIWRSHAHERSAEGRHGKTSERATLKRRAAMGSKDLVTAPACAGSWLDRAPMLLRFSLFRGGR